LFKIDTSGNFTVLHSFTGGDDGDHPQGVISDSAGNLYLTTQGGNPTCTGGFGCGLVVKLDTAGNYTVLHKFNVNGGNTPNGLVLDEKTGILYGAAAYGGLCTFCGTIFEITP
jgi:hypothetical protein